MLIHPDTVVAVLKQQMIPEQRQGIGRITKAEGRWYLQTPIERIPLELQPKGVVHEGEAVRYTINDGLISLTTIVADYRHAPTIPGDFFMPSAVPSSTAPQSSPSTAFPVTKIPGGLYLFTSVEEALSFVSQEKNSELRDRILLLLASDGVVAVKVDSGDDGIFRASLLSRAEISLSLTTLQTSFGSTALASISLAMSFA